MLNPNACENQRTWEFEPFIDLMDPYTFSSVFLVSESEDTGISELLAELFYQIILILPFLYKILPLFIFYGPFLSPEYSIMVSDLHMSNILEETKAGRQKIFENICSLLVSAGYFRARIPALSPFDKVFPLHSSFLIPLICHLLILPQL